MAIKNSIRKKIEGKKIALVLDGYINGMGVCRSLLKSDDVIVVCLNHKSSPTRFLNKRLLSITVKSSMEEVLKAINEVVSKAVCYPCSDKNMRLLMDMKDQLTNFSIPFINFDILEKSEQTRICNEANVLMPKTVISHKLDDKAAIEALGFPLMIKPSRSHKDLFKAEIVNDKASRDRLVERCIAVDIAAMVSEYIPGGDETLITLGGYAYNGEILSSFTGRKRSQRPHNRGVACMAESYEINGILKPSAKFVKACNYTGLFQVEFKRHESIGKDYFIEFNPRNWLWGYIATLSNRNLPITKFEKEANGELVVESNPQKYDHFFIWIEAIFYNLFKSKSLRDFKLYFKLRKTKKPSFALVQGLNIIPLAMSYFNLFFYLVGIKEKKR